MLKVKKSNLLLAALVAALISSTVPANAAAGITYMQGANASVTLTPFATAGDRIGNYLIGGIPDGMGVIQSGNKLRVVTNHEWSNSNAVAAARASSAGLTNGSYVSEMHYDLSKKEIVAGKDFMQFVEWFDYQALDYTYEPTAPKGAEAKDQYGSINHATLMNRFCSSTLADAGTFYSKSAGVGYKGAVYLTGEEGGDESRGFAGNEEGDFAQMPRLGLAAWETFVPAPTTTKSTVVFGNEDGSAIDSQLWMYKGNKQKDGSWYEQAGLANGSLCFSN